MYIEAPKKCVRNTILTYISCIYSIYISYPNISVQRRECVRPHNFRMSKNDCLRAMQSIHRGLIRFFFPYLQLTTFILSYRVCGEKNPCLYIRYPDFFIYLQLYIFCGFLLCMYMLYFIPAGLSLMYGYCKGIR